MPSVDSQAALDYVRQRGLNESVRICPLPQSQGDPIKSKEARQVKAYTLKDEHPRVGAYRTTLGELIEPSSEKNWNAACELVNLDPRRQAALDPHLPPQARAEHDQPHLAAALAKTSTLRQRS